MTRDKDLQSVGASTLCDGNEVSLKRLERIEQMRIYEGQDPYMIIVTLKTEVKRLEAELKESAELLKEYSNARTHLSLSQKLIACVDDIADLRKETSELRERLEASQAENAELREENARLNKLQIEDHERVWAYQTGDEIKSLQSKLTQAELSLSQTKSALDRYESAAKIQELDTELKPFINAITKYPLNNPDNT